jgi:hypothetical protein
MSLGTSFEPSVETKKIIVSNNLKSICSQIYDLVISATVANKIGNTKTAEAAQKQLELLEKTKHEYDEIYKSLEADGGKTEISNG